LQGDTNSKKYQVENKWEVRRQTERKQDTRKNKRGKKSALKLTAQSTLFVRQESKSVQISD